MAGIETGLNQNQIHVVAIEHSAVQGVHFGAIRKVAKTAREEGFEEIAEWFETLARAEKSHAGRFQKGLDTLK